MKKLAVCLVLVISGCTTQTHEDAEKAADRRFASYETERGAYMACAHLWGSLIIKKRPGTDPGYVAVAARQQCGNERASLISAIERTYDSSAWSRLLSIYDRKFDEVAISQAIKG
jgi:hypothetical protein